MVGRRAKPTPLKLVDGNPGKRPINNDEPQPEKLTTIPTAPTQLGPHGKREWRRVCKELDEMGMLFGIDRSIVHAYCAAYEQWYKLDGMCKEPGVLPTSIGATGSPIKNPLFALRTDASKEMRACMSEIGLTPSSRTKLHVKPKSDADKRKEKAQEFLYGNQKAG